MLTPFFAALALGQQMYGDHDQQVRDEIQSTYDRYAKAVLKDDLDATLGFLTTDIVWIYSNGKQEHRSEIRDDLKAWEDSIKPGTKMHFTIDRLKIDSDDQIEAYVTMHYQAPEDVTAKKPGRTSKWHDTWVQSHGRWQNSRGEQLAEKKKA